MPRMLLPAVIKLRSELLQICSLFRYGKLDADLYRALCWSLSRVLKVDLDVLQESLLYLQGRIQPMAVFETMAHRLAANVARLKEGHPVYPWTIQKRKEWVTVQILGAIPRLSSSMEAGALLTVKFMTGTVAGLTTKRWYSLRGCRGISRKVGFPKPKGAKSWDTPKLLYRIPDDLVTLRFEVLVDPEFCQEEPGYRETRKDVAAGHWNREQLRHRYRDGYACPRDYPKEVFCHDCPATLKQCRAATRNDPLVFVLCTKCEKKELGYSAKQPICVGCLRSEGYRYYTTKIKKEPRVKTKNKDMADAVQDGQLEEDPGMGDSGHPAGGG